MMRTCPKCGDYYADALLAFCLVDGAPLINVDTDSEKWRKGARVVEAKANALRRQNRKLKWQRIVVSAMAIATVAIMVLAVSSFIKVEREPGIDVVSAPSTPETDTTIIPKITMVATEVPTRDPASSATPSQNPSPTLTPTPTPTPDKTLQCSDSDKGREKEAILNKFGGIWRRKIEGDRSKIIAENMPAGIANAIGILNTNRVLDIAKVEATLGSIEYESRSPKPCLAFLTARYVWQVRKNLNGTVKVVSVAREKKFACMKTGETWRCS